jgi:hypothetical protein
MLSKLSNIASYLDKLGKTELVDELDNLIHKIAQSKPPTCLEDNTEEGWEKYHQWLKDNAWEQLKYKGIQAGYEDIPDTEMRDCNLCGSSLFKPIIK